MDNPDHGTELYYEFPNILRYYKNGDIERFDGTLISPATTDPTTKVKSKDLIIDELSGLSVRLYLPVNISPNKKVPILFFIHGGAFMIHTAGSPVYHNLVNSLVSNAKVVGASVTYRLVPEHPVLVAYEDTWDALKWVVKNCKYGLEPWLAQHGDLGHIILAGDSAGANIAHNIAVKFGNIGSYFDFPKIKELVLMNPYFWGKVPIRSERDLDHQFRVWLDQTWDFICAGKYGTDHPFLNPMGSEEDQWMKPRCERVMVTVAENDMFRERGREYVRVLKKNGWNGEVEIYETEGERHCYFLAKPKSEKAIKEVELITTFINRDKKI
ncbi:hypothetical protein LUZ60_002710 [Juncus effusus]|nr:hypothetical protein LUZ60_002710 [Juncus effusus]